MRTIERKDLEGRWPNNCDPKVFEMNDEVTSYYTGQYALYEHFLYLYLLKKTSLGKFDEEISRSELGIDMINRNDKDFYQIGSPLKYIYIRNNIYIERLNELDLKHLENKMLNGDFELDSETESLIERTYKIVTSERSENEPPHTVNYGPVAERFFASSDNLIIGIRYDDEIRNYQDTKEYERQNNIFDFISEVSIKLEDNISKELNRGVRSIVYNDTSVIKRQNNEKEL